MALKGNPEKQESALVEALLMEKLVGIDGITSKKMFGGYGVMYSGKMIAFIDGKGKCFFKGNETNIAEFEKIGATKHHKMPYYEISQNVWLDMDTLLKLVNSSIDIVKQNLKD